MTDKERIKHLQSELARTHDYWDTAMDLYSKSVARCTELEAENKRLKWWVAEKESVIKNLEQDEY